MLDFSLIMNYVFPISVMVLLMGVILDQIRIAHKIRILEMTVYNRSYKDQDEIDQANFYE